MTPAIYARYSTDLQREESIEDQVRACQRAADAAGLGPARVFADAGVSGASMARRPGLADLLDAVESGRVGAVIVESLDRLSRDQADLALIWRALKTANVRLITASEGEIRDDAAGIMQVGLRSIVGTLYLKDLADKTRRGIEGVVTAGRHAGPPPFGYRLKAGGQPGELEANPEQAALVLRIFTDYAAGLSPRAIAKALNAEGRPGPRGAAWRNTTIYGDPKKGTGILWNALYRGERVWNRQRKVKNPATGTARMVLNPQSAWVRIAAPDLALIDTTLAAAVEARREGASAPGQGNSASARACRPGRPLSGLMACGACGANMTLAGGEPRRYGCSAAKETGACGGVGYIRADIAEARLFAALKHQLLSAPAIKLAVDTYRAERARLKAEARAGQATLEARIARLARTEARLVDAFAEGRSPASVLDKAKAAETERLALEAELAEIAAQDTHAGRRGQVEELHPNAGAAYAARVERLQETLAGHPDTSETAPISARHRAEAIEAVRRLITRITVTRHKKSGETNLNVEGDLAALFNVSQASEKTVGAGARTGRVLTPVPWSFAA
jgi:DNA invertase Pin-like site-specific DNA recombinase